MDRGVGGGSGAAAGGAGSGGGAGDGPHGGPEYRIDLLARAAGTTVRNVRAYQDRGLLPPPRRTGRVGVYSGAHLARLRLIGSLLDRGYTLGNIAELLAAWERGQDVGAVLGLEAALGSPAAGGGDSIVDLDALASAFGPYAADAVDDAVSIGVLEEVGHGRFRVTDPLVLDVGRLLVGAGVPLGSVLEAARALRAQVDLLAQLFVGLVEEHVVAPMGDPIPPARVRELAGLVSALRPLASEVVAAELALALEDEIRRRLGDYLARRVDQGRLAGDGGSASPCGTGRGPAE